MCCAADLFFPWGPIFEFGNNYRLFFPSCDTASAEREIVRVVKEKLCYIFLVYDTELKSTAHIDKEKTLRLPIRKQTSSLLVTNVSVALRCCSSQISLVEVPADSTTLLSKRPECDGYIRKELHANVVLSGGTTIALQSVMKCDVCILEELYTNVLLSGDTIMFQ